MEEEKIEEKIISDGYMLIADGYGFYKFIEALSNISEVVPFDFDPIVGKLSIPICDPSRICLIEVIVSGDGVVGDITGNKRVYVNLKDLKTILKVKKEAKKHIKLIFGDREKLCVEKFDIHMSSMIKKTLVYIDAEIEDMPMENLMKVVYPNEVHMTKKQLDDMFYEAQNYSDIVKITTSVGGITFSEEGINGEYDAIFENDKLYLCDCKGIEKSAYSYTYLNLVKNMLKIMLNSEIVEIHEKTDHPIKIIIDIDTINTTIAYFIASRVEEDVYDDDEDDEW